MAGFPKKLSIFLCSLLAVAGGTQAQPTQFSFQVIDGTITITGFASFGHWETELIIPETLNGLPVTRLGNNAFESAHRLGKATIPTTITELGDWVFNACVGLTNVTIPASVTRIGDWSFSRCTALPMIAIPERLRHRKMAFPMVFQSRRNPGGPAQSRLQQRRGRPVQ